MSTQDELAKIAALETELAQLRRLKNDLISNPSGTLQKMGVPKEHITQVLVADALGDQAPPQLRAAAAVGPVTAAVSSLTEKVDALASRLESSDRDTRARATRDATKNLAADKTKYPHLARALAADPTYLDGEAIGDSAENSAKAVEERLARAAKVFGFTPPASDEDAGKQQADGTPPAVGTGRKPQAHQGGNPPSNPQGSGRDRVGWTDDDRIALRDEIVRKYERGEYDVPTHPYRLP